MSAAETHIRPAVPEDAPAIASMLAQLGAELGDPPAATEATLRANGFGSSALFHTLIAEDDAPVGFALYFAHFSTTRGQAGAYVQDLWTDPRVRGQGLGAQLLAAVATATRRDWNADYLILSVHGHNDRAARFYTRLGFQPDASAQPMALDGDGFAALAKEAA